MKTLSPGLGLWCFITITRHIPVTPERVDEGHRDNQSLAVKADPGALSPQHCILRRRHFKMGIGGQQGRFTLLRTSHRRFTTILCGKR